MADLAALVVLIKSINKTSTRRTPEINALVNMSENSEKFLSMY